MTSWVKARVFNITKMMKTKKALDAQPKAAADTALLKADNCLPDFGKAQLVDDQATKDILREGEYSILKDVGINENSVTEFLKLLTRHNAALLREPEDEVLLTKYFSTQWKAGVRNGHIGPAPATGENAGRSASSAENDAAAAAAAAVAEAEAAAAQPLQCDAEAGLALICDNCRGLDHVESQCPSPKAYRTFALAEAVNKLAGERAVAKAAWQPRS